MRLPPFSVASPGSAVGDGVSGSVEFGLKEREDSEMEPWISLMLADFPML